MLKTTLRKSGNSLVITIPPAIVNLIDATDGTVFEINIQNNNTELVLKKEIIG